MEMSEEVDKLFEGMFALKGKLQQPKFDASVDYKNKNGTKTEFKYATLRAIETSIRTAAQESQSGVDFQQEVLNKDNKLSVTTLVCHTSGQWVKHGPFDFPNSGSNPQALGSLATYARRYALSAAFGIAADNDDDAQTANDNQDKKQQQNKQQQQPQKDERSEAIQTIGKYRKELSLAGKLQEIDSWIAEKEKTTEVNKVDLGRLIGYYKAAVMRLQESQKQEPIQTEIPGIAPVKWGQ